MPGATCGKFDVIFSVSFLPAFLKSERTWWPWYGDIVSITTPFVGTYAVHHFAMPGRGPNAIAAAVNGVAVVAVNDIAVVDGVSTIDLIEGECGHQQHNAYNR